MSIPDTNELPASIILFNIEPEKSMAKLVLKLLEERRVCNDNNLKDAITKVIIHLVNPPQYIIRNEPK